MDGQISFIERQFPVSKISKESYKERKSSQGQTITGLGKWWGRKPLVLVRAAIIGCLMPASDDPFKDMDIFLKIMSMDKAGLLKRKEKHFTNEFLYNRIYEDKKLRKTYIKWFENSSGRWKLPLHAPKEEMERAVFQTLGYDEKIAMCVRPEQLQNLEEDTWEEINQHLGTSAHEIQELIAQLSEKKFGHKVILGDCFCGGGSIPFEAARIGCNVLASDLNPIAGLLTWASLHICGASEKELEQIRGFQQKVYDDIDKEICELGIEHNEKGDRALSYLYCMESTCPECGYQVPLLPSLVVGTRAGRVVAVLKEKAGSFDIEIKENASPEELREAQVKGTVRNNSLVCPHCGRSTPISVLRQDRLDERGNTVYGLRMWERDEFEPRKEDVYQERLYAVRYEHFYMGKNGKMSSLRYYCAPGKWDLENERKVQEIVRENFHDWQREGIIPSAEIECGDKTEEVKRNRGWRYWHQLFGCRSLLILTMIVKRIQSANDTKILAASILGLNKCVDYMSNLCRWHAGCDKSEQTFYNQALNTLFAYGIKSWTLLKTLWFISPNRCIIAGEGQVALSDARDIRWDCDLWITDPPYADAINYHELSEFFLAWDRPLIPRAFPQWYTDSKRILAVRGDRDFSQTMIDIYTNLAEHMSDNGMQIVMFTHNNPAVWAQLAIIMWKAGLKVTAAWNVATETDASGLKNGNYVKGTVLLVLRKQTGNDTAFLDEINADIRGEVKNQIESMQKLDDKEEPNFSDPDYVLAAYAASLKALTAYVSIEDLDLDYELDQAIKNPASSKMVSIIENAKKIAYDCVIPLEFDRFLWRELSSAEKFYIKGLESEKHGNYQIGTYQEFARGFSVGGYPQLMASERANMARLKTPFEMAGRTMNDVPDFEASVTRTIFQGIYVGVKEDLDPGKALGYIKNEIIDYWDKREMIRQILSFLIDIENISNMQPHWAGCAKVARLLLALVTHDSI